MANIGLLIGAPRILMPARYHGACAPASPLLFLWFSAAVAVLGLHLLFNLWYVFGALVTKGRPRLEILHIVSLFYGVIAENASFPCPLTRLEKWRQAQAGFLPYRGAFAMHDLRNLVAPSFPLWLLEYGAIGVFVVNLAIYAHRFAARYSHTHPHRALAPRPLVPDD